ncbi:monocarboxylate transporter 3-like [Amphiura filiformis]|uniref:monocarboxylate transporter 3-like n=1 Tax=Amphiura filiformis TaxID=82378 RepID=UPI003B21011A
MKSFSVLLMDLKEQLVTSTWVVGSCISIITGCGSLLGVTSGAIVNLLNPRLAIMLSGLLASIGLLICSCATNSGILLMGLALTGFLMMQINIALGLVPLYFDKYYEAAVAIYSCGTGIAILTMPIVAQTFLDTYGWRGTLLLLSGLALHSIPCGTLVTERSPSESIKPESESLLNGRNRKTPEGNKSVLQMKNKANPVVMASAWNALKALCNDLGGQLLTQSAFVSRVLIPGFTYGYIITGWMIYIVSFTVSKGASIKEGSIVATFGGLGVIMIRIAAPLLNKFIAYKHLLYLSSIIAATSLSSIPFFGSFTGMCFIVTISGIGIGLFGVELYISANYNCKESDHFHAIAWLHLVYGAGALLTGFLTGYLFDVTGSFAISFYILGAVASVTAMSLAVGDICLGLKDYEK